MQMICGVDEAGRGALAGPVCAAALILHPKCKIHGLADSKTLSAIKRKQISRDIYDHALTCGIGWSSAEEIDRINILQATHLAMQRAIDALAQKPDMVLIDGNSAPKLDMPYETIIKGDAKEAVISGASILAKTARDSWMMQIDAKYPQYGFAQHKGYGVKAHLQAIAEFGPCPIHRQSFRPISGL